MQPSFDTWTIVFLLAAAQSLLLAVALVARSGKGRYPNRLLALLLFLFAITLTEYVLYWTGYTAWFPHSAEISLQFPLLYGPVLWWYLRAVFDRVSFQKKDIWHLTPFLVSVVIFLPWYVKDAETKRQMLSAAGAIPFPVAKAIIMGSTIFRVLHLLVYTGWMFWYVRRQPSAGLSARWSRGLVLFFGGFVLAYTSYYVLVHTSWFHRAWDYHISAAMSVFIYLIAFYGYLQPAIFNGFVFQEAVLPPKYQHSGLTPEAGRSLARKLEAVMAQEKLYRDPELRLDMLAARLGAGKHHVSQVINEYLETNFFEYINQLRIEDAKEMLAATNRSDLHVIEAAYAVGFNNKVSFNNAFKKATGMTPTQYRQSHGKTDRNAGQPGSAD